MTKSYLQALTINKPLNLSLQRLRVKEELWWPLIATLSFGTAGQLKERNLSHRGAEKPMWVISEIKRLC